MSKLWGPLGWMTLHSISLNYPDTPSELDKYIAKRFLALFADTISCNACKSHFKTMWTLYSSVHPNYLESKQQFALFVFRAHNTVNKRLDKPRHGTVAACIAALRNATSQTSLAQFRNSYLTYLNRNWGRDNTGDGFIMKSSVKEMVKINNEYWSLRDISIPDLIEDDVLTPIEHNGLRIAPSGVVSSVAVGFKGGKLRLMKR